MSDPELPAHLMVLVTDLQADPVLRHGVVAAVGELEGAAAVEAAVDFYRLKGYQVSAEELTALEIARKEAVGEPLSEYELEAVSGGEIVSTVIIMGMLIAGVGIGGAVLGFLGGAHFAAEATKSHIERQATLG